MCPVKSFHKKKKRSDYNCNIFRSDLNSLLSIWNTEIHPMIKNIRTYGETEHKAYVSYISDDGIIMDYDEAYAASIMKGIRRISIYNSVLDMIYGQYIYLIGGIVEYFMIKVLKKNEHSPEGIDRKAVSNILKCHYVEINEI